MIGLNNKSKYRYKAFIPLTTWRSMAGMHLIDRTFTKDLTV